MAESCTDAGPAGSSLAPPGAGAASGPPRTLSAGHSALTVGSWAAGKRCKVVTERKDKYHVPGGL